MRTEIDDRAALAEGHSRPPPVYLIERSITVRALRSQVIPIDERPWCAGGLRGDLLLDMAIVPLIRCACHWVAQNPRSR